jgi:uncharacterized membrane protein
MSCMFLSEDAQRPTGLQPQSADAYFTPPLVLRACQGGRGSTSIVRTMPDGASSDLGTLLFEAVIVPHRSLSRRGLIILLSAITGLCGLTAFRFWLIGAWPVIGFSVVEVGLALCLISLNARQARATELVLLTAQTLRIVRVDARGLRRECTLDPAWLNVAVEELPGRVPKVVLVARGVREEIATTLGETEKRDLANALGAALHRRRHPTFENSQLRD